MHITLHCRLPVYLVFNFLSLYLFEASSKLIQVFEIDSFSKQTMPTAVHTAVNIQHALSISLNQVTQQINNEIISFRLIERWCMDDGRLSLHGPLQTEYATEKVLENMP